MQHEFMTYIWIINKSINKSNFDLINQVYGCMVPCPPPLFTPGHFNRRLSAEMDAAGWLAAGQVNWSGEVGGGAVGLLS